VTVVYADEVFLLNVLLDGLLLKTTAWLGGFPLSRRRLCLAAAMGGAYALLAALFPVAGGRVGQFLAGLLLGLLAFWGQRYLLRQLLLFFMVSGTYAGFVLGMALFWQEEISPSLWSLVLALLLAVVLCGGVFARFALHGGSRGDLRSVALTRRGKTLCFTALYDSGNTLTQPGSGAPLLVVDAAVLQPLWEEPLRAVLTNSALSSPEETLKKLCLEGYDKCFTLRHFRTASDPDACLLLFKSDALRVGQRQYGESWVGLSPHALTDGGGYCALWGGKEKDDELAEDFLGKTGAFPGRKAYVHRGQRCAAPASGSTAGAAGVGADGTGPGRPTASY